MTGSAGPPYSVGASEAEEGEGKKEWGRVSCASSHHPWCHTAQRVKEYKWSIPVLRT